MSDDGKLDADKLRAMIDSARSYIGANGYDPAPEDVIAICQELLSRRTSEAGAGEVVFDYNKHGGDDYVDPERVPTNTIVGDPVAWPINLDVVSSAQFVARVQSDAITSIAMPMVEELSKRPGTTWGEIVKAMRDKAAELWAAASPDTTSRDSVIEECAKVVETALREDYRKKTGQERSLSEAEIFFAAAIRALQAKP